jgi:hypothetical protein
LQEALKVILAYDDPNRRRKRDADKMLAAQRKRLKEETEKQEQVRYNRDRFSK